MTYTILGWIGGGAVAIAIVVATASGPFIGFLFGLGISMLGLVLGRIADGVQRR